MTNKTLFQKSAKLFLLLAALIWGSSFVIMKNTIDHLPTFYLLSIRFLTAGILLSLVFLKRWKQLKKEYLWRGFLMGVFLFLAY
ncbi:MAG: EamA family transporter, partial [Oscillospiraceae bacterium]|nr:EamA family transporter [Oscillospiraceae bacterium]